MEGKMVPCAFLQDVEYYDKTELPKFDKDFVNTWKTNEHFQAFRKGNLRECQARSYIFNKSLKKEDPYGVDAFKKYILCRDSSK